MKIKKKTLKIKFESNSASKFFIRHCEYYMRNLEYRISSSVNEFNIQITGDSEKIRQVANLLRKFAIEVNNAFLLNKDKTYQIGTMVIERGGTGILNQNYLCDALRYMGYQADIINNAIYTSAPLYTVIKINNDLFHILQNTNPTYNLDIRKFVSLLLLKHGGNEEQIIEFCIHNNFLRYTKKSKERLHLSGSLDSLLNLMGEAHLPTSTPSTDQKVDPQRFFGGGEIVIFKKKQ